MAINKPRVAVGFIVAGALTVVSGVFFLIVGPMVMKDQVIKVSLPMLHFRGGWRFLYNNFIFLN